MVVVPNRQQTQVIPLITGVTTYIPKEEPSHRAWNRTRRGRIQVIVGCEIELLYDCSVHRRQRWQWWLHICFSINCCPVILDYVSMCVCIFCSRQCQQKCHNHDCKAKYFVVDPEKPLSVQTGACKYEVHSHTFFNAFGQFRVRNLQFALYLQKYFESMYIG